jgi:hypothetical protein
MYMNKIGQEPEQLRVLACFPNHRLTLTILYPPPCAEDMVNRQARPADVRKILLIAVGFR